jgi:putative DNA primase/helicase
MADERWFMEDLSLRLVDDDTKRTLCGKWLVEMAEFPHLKNEAEVFKAFVSGQTDRYREKFGIRSADHPRQCVFAGTTNRLEFVDDTGNTRMWPVQCCGPIDFDRIERDRDWLFAEALAAYHAGERVWLSDNVEPVARRQQDKFLPDDAWSVPVQRWINHRLVPVAPMTMHEVMVGIGLEQLSQQNNSAQVRVGKILRSLGWEPGEKETIDGERVRRWRQVKLIS